MAGERSRPIRLGSRDETEILANKEILASSPVPTTDSAHGSKIRLTFAVSTSGVLQIRYSETGTWLDILLGASLNADDLYSFVIPVGNGNKINFRYSVATTTRVFRVDEILVE